MKDILYSQSHRRLNILTGEWVQVSPHRTKRPWQGQVEKVSEATLPSYDEHCYLCPGNKRASGQSNPDYKSTYSFKNDFEAIESDIKEVTFKEGLLSAKSERGTCKVVCFSPKHNLTLPEMSISHIEEVILIWMKEYQELSSINFVNYIQIFENKGAVMGCSNPHPHGQIWAQESIPVEVDKKNKQQLEHFTQSGSVLLNDYLVAELKNGERILYENEHMVVLIPFWAVWPFETMILPKHPSPNINSLTSEEVSSFADALSWLTIKYDNLFEISFPYSSGIHQAPCDGKEYPEWHWHMSFYPPLLRSATVKKFMVGYEMFANPQRDTNPEQVADILRSLPDIHYKLR